MLTFTNKAQGPGFPSTSSLFFEVAAKMFLRYDLTGGHPTTWALDAGGFELFTLLIGVDPLIVALSMFDDMIPFTFRDPFVSEELSMVSVNTLLCPETMIFCEDEQIPSLEGSKGNNGFSSSCSELVKLLLSGSLSGDWDPGRPSLNSVALRFRLFLLTSEMVETFELSTEEQSENPR